MNALLMEVGLKSGLVCLIALGLVLSARRLPAAKRAVVAHLGLLAVLIVPVIAMMGPDLTVTGFWSSVVEVSPVTNEPTSASPLAAQDHGGFAFLAPHRSVDVVVAIWAAVASLLVIGLGMGLIRLYRLQRRAWVVTDRDWLGALAVAQQRMGVKHGTALLGSAALRSPVSWGLVRPTIVLSAEALKTPEHAEAILSHELAHLVRMDWANLLIARLAIAVFWFNPLVWILALQAHELREEAADDVVLRGDTAAPDYATLLVGFARRERQAPALAAHGVAPGKASLRRRLVRVLDRAASREPASIGWTLTCSVAVAALTGPLGAFTPADRFELQRPSVPSSLVAPEFAAGDTKAGVFNAATSSPPPSHVLPSNNSIQSPPLTALRRAALADRPRPSGVTQEWMTALRAELPFVGSLPPEQLAVLANNGVSARWVREMEREGYDHLTYSEVVALAAHGVGAAYVQDLRSAGYDDLPADRLVQMKIHGVNANSVRRTDAQSAAPPEETTAEARRRRPPPIPAWPPTSLPPPIPSA